jgi:hypothetical protein
VNFIRLDVSGDSEFLAVSAIDLFGGTDRSRGGIFLFDGNLK